MLCLIFVELQCYSDRSLLLSFSIGAVSLLLGSAREPGVDAQECVTAAARGR